MNSNKVVFGLEQVHIAFQGVCQTKSIELTAGCGTDGSLTATITGALLTGGTEAVTVPLDDVTHAGAEQVASAMVDACNNNADIAAHYRLYRVGATVYLAAVVAADDDNTMAIAITPGSTGVTAGAAQTVAAGTTGWGAPVAVPGAVNISTTPTGEEVKFVADNKDYFVSTSNDGYALELEMALIPNDILKDMMGWRIDANGGLVEVQDGTPKHFALMGQVQGDSKNRRSVWYDCLAARSAATHATTKTPTPSTSKLTINVAPMVIAGEKVVKYVLEAGDTGYSTFFDAVPQPVAA